MSRDPLEYALNRMEAERDKPPPTVGYPAARQELLDGIAALRAENAALKEERDRLRDQGSDDTRVFFYERQFYVLSNFSAFNLAWKGELFDTSEAAYHSEKFPDRPDIRAHIRDAMSAHAALKLAEQFKDARRPDWESVRVGIMRDILWEKADQHEYVIRKLLETGGRELIENSWRDGFWGWAPEGKGRNVLGKLWMEIRDELRCRATEGK